MNKMLAAPLIAMLAGCVTSNTSLPTQPGVDLKKYTGTWYEQARLPNRFQKVCAGDVQADYKLNADNTIGVTNQCRTKDGSVEKAEGVARLSKSADPRDPAVLQVRFAPKWLSWLPLVWGDYWIIKLQDGYQYALVGTPDRKYLWVLSRNQQADASVINELLGYARTLGFPIEQIKRTGS